MTEPYTELGGRRFHPYEFAKQRECPTCRAKQQQPCINPITGKASKIACIARLKEKTP